MLLFENKNIYFYEKSIFLNFNRILVRFSLQSIF